MPSIVQAINEFKFEATVEEVFAFALERERIRQKRESGESFPWTDDPILRDSKFLNVYREHDKVSRVVNDILGPIKHIDNALYIGAYICRLVNHHEHLKWLFNDGHKWMSTVEQLREKMIEFTNRDSTVCNPGAYQINPRIGFKYNHRNIRASMVNVVPDRAPYVIKAFASTDQIDIATERANEAFGGFTNFWMFQAALDIAWHRPDLMDRHSHCYYGSGSKNAVVDQEEMLTYANNNKPDGWREFYPFDIENMMCEYRKYRMRMTKGIPNNRRYKNG